MSRSTRYWPVRIVIVAVAAVAVTGLSGAVATADGAGNTGPDVKTYEVLREVIKPWDSIKIPSASCPGGFLHNHSYSPGRIVPAGVEVIEPGGVGVTIAPGTETGPVWTENGRLIQPISGWDANEAYSGATNWDPFASHEVVVRLHCTLDTDHAVVEDLGPSPF